MKFEHKKFSNGFENKFLTVGEYTLHTLISEDLEDGQLPVVMVHGALASRRYFMPTAKLLRRHVQVYIPELPGHGASSKVKRALSVEQQAQVLYEWFELNDIKRAHVYANSYGCQISACFAAKHPKLLESLILCGPTCDTSARNLVRQAYRLYIDGFNEPLGSRLQLIADLSDMTVPVAFETAQEMVRNDIRPNLAEIRCRTMVMRGEKDTIAPQRWAKEVAKRIKKSQLCVVKGSPHCVNYASGPQLTKIITEFIKER